MRALSVAVASSVLGTSLVGGVRPKATVFLHLDEVESTVETARKVGDIDVEGEFLVLHVEHLVFALVRHEVHAGADVGRVWALGDECEGEVSARGSDTVGAGVVGTVEGTAGSARLAIGAESRIPLVAGVAVVGTFGGVQPAPVGVEGNSEFLGRVRICCTLRGITVYIQTLCSCHLPNTQKQ